MKRLVVVPHVRGSHATRDLADMLSAKLGFKVFRVPEDKVGKRIAFRFQSGTDKLTQMERFQAANVSIPEFTVDRNVAISWLPDTSVVCRTLLRGSEGRGIVVAETNEQIVPAPLYTKYFKKKKEFRVHVFNGTIIDVQEKRKRSGVENVNHYIRNLTNGYVFCRDAIVRPTGLEDLALRATAALGYTIGAVDIAWNEHYDRLVVFEVNSNPGLQGTTLDNYSNAIIEWYRSQV